MNGHNFPVSQPKLSVVIPSRNEERYIAQCLNSLLEMTYPKESVEILVVDGMSEDSTRQIVTDYSQKYPFIRLLDNPKKITPTALNTGVTAAAGEFIIILSAHADYPKEYCFRLVEEAIRLNASCVGGVMRTKSSKTDTTSQSIINVLSDRFGTASQFRSGTDKIIEVDTVAFGCYPRDIFTRFGLFDECLVRNQDIELNKRIIRGGGKIYLIPSVECSYYARETYRELAKNNFLNGYWNILTPYYSGSLRSLSLRHFIPLLFMLSLIIPLFFSILDFHFLWISAGLFFLYLTIITVRSYKIKKNTTWLHQIAAFIVLHFSYGIGGINGIIALIKKILFRKTQ
ncbi:MAG: glycosyltransferase family 2 protein [Sulfuricurvum sp.]|nr:glycosyltransferase family 2 protein [Sulfuricurvum sp.]